MRRFYFRLALALGMTVADMLARISSHELNEWRAYYTLEPFGEGVADLRHGIATATLANVNRNADRRGDPFRAEEFIPWHPVNLAKKEGEGELLADPEAQSNLIKSRLFKKT